MLRILDLKVTYTYNTTQLLDFFLFFPQRKIRQQNIKKNNNKEKQSKSFQNTTYNFSVLNQEANVPLLYPLKTSKTKHFLTFSGGRGRKFYLQKLHDQFYLQKLHVLYSLHSF